MKFRCGKYDAHEGQQRPMHQVVVRITDVAEGFITSLFGDRCRVTLIQDGNGAAIIRKALVNDLSTRISFSQGHWGVSFQELRYKWIADIAPAWGLMECETSIDYSTGEIRFIYPPLNYRFRPRQVHRGVFARGEPPASAPAAVGDVLMYIGDECFTSKGVPASMLEGIKRMVGVDNWE